MMILVESEGHAVGYLTHRFGVPVLHTPSGAYPIQQRAFYMDPKNGEPMKHLSWWVVEVPALEVVYLSKQHAFEPLKCAEVRLLPHGLPGRP